MRRRILSRSKGFTLIEAMVALLVLSLGLLGVAAMQFKALQSAHMGYQRSVASLMAIDAQESAWSEMAQQLDKECPDASGLQSDWLTDWSAVGVLRDIDPSNAWTGSGPANDCTYQVQLVWGEGRLVEVRDGDGDVTFEETQQAFLYEFRLPQLN